MDRRPSFAFGVLALVTLLVMVVWGWPVFAQPRPIVFGASISMTGRYAQTGLHFRRGYELWKDQVNARGGLLGRPVAFVIYDDKSDPTTGARLYERLITQDKVDFVLGPYSSPVTLAVSTVTEKYRYPLIAAGASITEICQRGYNYVFQTVAPGETYLDGAIDIAATRGLKRVAVINSDSLYPKAFSKAAVEKVRARGMEVVLHEAYPEKATDLSAVLTKVKSVGAEVLISGTYFNDAVLIVRQMKELGVYVKILAQTVGPSLPDFGQALGPLAENVYGATQWEPIPTMGFPGVADFIEAFEKSYGYLPTYQVAESYGGMQVLQRATEQVGSLDREKVREALGLLEMKTVFGPYAVDAKGCQIKKTALLIQWQKGQRVVVWPDDVATGRPVFPMPQW
jgi:branched-chain amino acid transport system substrate-binding protein